MNPSLPQGSSLLGLIVLLPLTYYMRICELRRSLVPKLNNLRRPSATFEKSWPLAFA
jgi:hypothetical protein